MERDDRPAVAGFVWEGDARPGELVRLPESVARHALVRRLRPGARVRLSNGRGTLAFGEAHAVGPKEFLVAVAECRNAPRPESLELIVPVADRDRMLIAAEKCVELQATSWQPVWFARSRSVSPRGEGANFRDKLRARMVSALEQSGGAWLPESREEIDFADALQQTAGGQRFVLDAGGAPLATLVKRGSVTLVIGPEGGMETQEIAAAESFGWVPASIGESVLRFETAIIAGASVVRALQQSTRSV